MKPGRLVHLFFALFIYSTAWADQPPEYYLEIRYSLVSEVNERTGIVYDYWTDSEQRERYLNMPNKLLDDFRASPELDPTTVKVFDDILLYKFPLPLSFDGKASFNDIGAREVSLKDIRAIVITKIYAVDYDGSLHSRLTKEDLQGWAKENDASLIADIDGNYCFFRLYRHGNGISGTNIIEKIKSLIPNVDFGSDWRSDPKNHEYQDLISQLREHHIVMIEYCGC